MQANAIVAAVLFVTSPSAHWATARGTGYPRARTSPRSWCPVPTAVPLAERSSHRRALWTSDSTAHCRSPSGYYPGCCSSQIRHCGRGMATFAGSAPRAFGTSPLGGAAPPPCTRPRGSLAPPVRGRMRVGVHILCLGGVVSGQGSSAACGKMYPFSFARKIDRENSRESNSVSEGR